MVLLHLHQGEKKLKEFGIKVTPQRSEILEILTSTRSHPGVEWIYQEVRKKFPSVSLATVYKTVELFVRMGIIQEISIARDVSRYDARMDPHPHVTCINCGRVDDVEGEFLLSEEARESVEKATGYKILKEETMYLGYCKDCRMDN